ncbi:PREDICTED: inositol monophosphatase 1-like [Nicrophorus vespilloides]|uniref:Inositol-1-monophosphatase n=1 Tax=Nicrophorus vespilloides TaxID=110193 RepID=A0ABM1M107_NICVS|nr:PREDICTED: inositol monophosphatase 1-like [Nicrophorus vespilloides]
MTSAENIDAYFDCVLGLTKIAGELIREKVKAGVKVNTKDCDIDLVTETDQEVEKLLINGLKTNFPSHKFIGEETVASGQKCELSNSPTWVIDPIDGTMNFVHAFPHCCISVALFIDAAPVIGIIYNPTLEQLFTAKKGQGAYLNGEKIHVSKVATMNKALLMMENGTSREPERVKTVFANHQILIPKLHGTRTLGSAALNMAMVAMGAADAYFEFGIHIWDIGAGEILITEAGGVVIDPVGGPLDRCSRRVLCASTNDLAVEFTKCLQQYYPMPRD